MKFSDGPARKLADETDPRLVAAVARGDSAAFSRLTDRHLIAVHRLAARMLGDANEADEVTQDTFLKLWTHANRWRPAKECDTVLPWLRTIAMNACIDRIRRRRFDGGENIPDRADDAATAPEKIDEARLSGMVERALLGLAERQRSAVVLTYYEELSNAEAAATMDLHLKAFESLLVRARQNLKAALTASGIGLTDLKEVA